MTLWKRRFEEHMTTEMGVLWKVKRDDIICLLLSASGFVLTVRCLVFQALPAIKRGVLWQQRERLWSRWKERYFVLTSDYLHCFKRRAAGDGLSQMGHFIFKASTQSNTRDKKGHQGYGRGDTRKSRAKTSAVNASASITIVAYPFVLFVVAETHCSAPQIRLVDLDAVEWVNRRSYSVVALSTRDRPRVLLRAAHGLEDWFELLEVRFLILKKREFPRYLKDFRVVNPLVLVDDTFKTPGLKILPDCTLASKQRRRELYDRHPVDWKRSLQREGESLEEAAL
ncbi:Reducing polyketide synthase PKS1 [Frankliniella fusca]|uniref:Reducing polyketide synthase PKS1 n=1 Tax=Frankliniella fusca TaxID=407009 RepID=A0AAE1H5X1_9NEOP|nr:Reducing polyketide synthase PKS1 [Frankliniella fusca]